MYSNKSQVFSSKLNQNNVDAITKAIMGFDALEGGFGKRNLIKHVEIPLGLINIKSFKMPNPVNKIAYRFFRKSKAQRSFEFAKRLLSLGVNTPEPLAYFEFSSLISFQKSFYISRQFENDITFRDLIHEDYPDFEKILRGFTRFTFDLHEKGINFLDHSPGNTLIKKSKDGYIFYLVDLNRMVFEEMDFHARMKNFAKLSPQDAMLDIMSDEYAKLYKAKSKEEIKDTMYLYSKKFSSRYKKKEALKKKYYFWR